jgi:hypothetical protein
MSPKAFQARPPAIELMATSQAFGKRSAGAMLARGGLLEVAMPVAGEAETIGDIEAIGRQAARAFEAGGAFAKVARRQMAVTAKAEKGA